jgi:HPt (histidine-containing phosphotransfer) domain-containing protein
MVSAEPVNTNAVLSAEPNGPETASPDAFASSEGLSPDTLDRVAGIADRARERNLDRAEELAGWVIAAEQGELTIDGRMVAAEVAHQLAGSAGTFGYQDATERAREVEAIFNHGQNAQSWQRASDCIQAVIGELNQPPS